MIAFIGIGYASGSNIPVYIIEEEQCPDCPECSLCPEETNSAIDQIKSRGELIVGTSANFSTFEFYIDFEIIDFYIDLSQIIADELGVNLTITDISFDTLIAACNLSTIDMIASAMVYIELCAETFSPSITYISLS